MRAPLVPAALLFMLGILAASLQPLAWGPLVGIGSAAAVLAWLFRRRPWVSALALLMLWGALGALRYTLWAHQPVHHVARLVSEEPARAAVHGVVVEDPVELFAPHEPFDSASPRSGRMVSEVEPEPEQQVCVIRARHVRARQAPWRSVSGLIRTKLQQPRVELAYGDEVLVEGAWSSVRGPGNPGQFDWRAALARQGVQVVLSVKPSDGMARLRTGQGAWWMRAVTALRARIESLLSASFSEHHAGLLRAILLGERVALDEDLKQAFIETGTMHLVVISGFNVGLIAVLLELFLRVVVGLSRRPRLLITAAGLLGYCLLTGMQPPVVRATLMAWVVLGALWMDRLISWPNTLAAAALVILWAQPAQLMDAGFQLSFGAVASLLIFTGRMQALLEPHLPIRLERLRRYVAVSLASTLAIWVGLWPVLAWYFHLVSPVSVLANLVLVPLVSLLVGLGTVVVLLGTVTAPVMHWTTGWLAWLVDVTVGWVHAFHQVPLGWWPIGHPAWPVIVGYYLLVGLSVWRQRIRLSPGWAAVCWLAGINLWIWTGVGAEARAPKRLEITVLDVGHGDAIVIRTPSRQTLLVDAGTQDAGRYAVVPFLRAQGYHTLEALILTHPDEDHVGGAVAVLKHLRVRQLLTNGFEASSRTAQQVFALADERRVPRARVTAGTMLAGSPAVTMTVLHPPPGFVPGTRPASNDNSVVMRVAMDKFSLLLCGDLEERGVPWLLAGGGPLRSTILKVPHHGSALGAAQRVFFRAVNPRAAILSVGRLHDLPDREVLSDLRDLGARLFLTRRDGAIIVRTDGTRLFVHTYRQRPPTRAPQGPVT
ncbi:MAG: DNA internalization-related competence protein ComEC/Rec2 [Candidatus Omnitrophica bacterium]|nr:DNA internalization-related competence protein ComEC/Rec2 [Candidatus Omnitrophota bacterium]